MKVYFECAPKEPASNINIAGALTEALRIDDLREIAQYLMVFVNNNNESLRGAKK